jgi:hypothetical protein
MNLGIALGIMNSGDSFWYYDEFGDSFRYYERVLIRSLQIRAINVGTLCAYVLLRYISLCICARLFLCEYVSRQEQLICRIKDNHCVYQLDWCLNCPIWTGFCIVESYHICLFLCLALLLSG